MPFDESWHSQAPSGLLPGLLWARTLEVCKMFATDATDALSSPCKLIAQAEFTKKTMLDCIAHVGFSCEFSMFSLKPVLKRQFLHWKKVGTGSRWRTGLPERSPKRPEGLSEMWRRKAVLDPKATRWQHVTTYWCCPTRCPWSLSPTRSPQLPSDQVAASVRHDPLGQELDAPLVWCLDATAALSFAWACYPQVKWFIFFSIFAHIFPGKWQCYAMFFRYVWLSSRWPFSVWPPWGGSASHSGHGNTQGPRRIAGKPHEKSHLCRCFLYLTRYKNPRSLNLCYWFRPWRLKRSSYTPSDPSGEGIGMSRNRQSSLLHRQWWTSSRALRSPNWKSVQRNCSMTVMSLHHACNTTPYS